MHLLLGATLGRFQGRKPDGHPGTEAMWTGLPRCDDITTAWTIMQRRDAIRVRQIIKGVQQIAQLEHRLDGSTETVHRLRAKHPSGP